MRSRTALKWIGIYLAADALWGVLFIVWVLATGKVPFVGGVGTGLYTAVGVGNLLLGLIGLRKVLDADRTPLKPVALLLAVLTIYGAVDAFWAAATGIPLSWTTAGLAVDGIVMLTVVFFLVLMLVRYLLSLGGGVFGVARTVLEEAIRMKVAVVFMALLLVILPIMPFVISSGEPLRYRVQSFLSYSLMLTSLLLSLMTIFLACGTLSNEISERQIFTVATKPIRRGTYLIGKWLGIVLLDAILLSVAGAAIYGFTTFYLVNLPAINYQDAAALHNEVLVARVVSAPQPKIPLDDQADAQLKHLMQTDPHEIEKVGQQYAAQEDITGANHDQIMKWGSIAVWNQYREQLGKQWLSVGPTETVVYDFDGLKPVLDKWKTLFNKWKKQAADAKTAGNDPPPPPDPRLIQLRYKINVSKNVPDDQIIMQVAFNGHATAMKMVTGVAQVVTIPVNLVDENGRLEIVWRNPLENNPTITFASKKGLELLYRVGDFGPNFLRTLLSMWAKLAFLAMLGLAAATFLGFPVACLLALLIYAAASCTPFLIDAMHGISSKPADTFGVVEYGMKTIDAAVVTVVGQYSQYPAASNIVDGRLFSWGDTVSCMFWIGVIWTLVVGGIAWLIFQRRELARVQV